MDEIVKAYIAWEKTGFKDGPEKERYEELRSKQVNEIDAPKSCSLDDEGCLSCGS